MNMSENPMNEAIEKLKQAIVNDYAFWTDDRERGEFLNDEYYEGRVKEFAEGISVSEGKKYIKLITGSSVWGFVMKEDDAKFKKGDLLKAASWAAPARNKARGNILTDDYEIRWTGPLYL
jgi:hypothetical protein